MFQNRAFATLLVRRSSGLIGAGLIVLIAAMIWPFLPTATGFSLIALGATCATIARLHRSPIVVPAMTWHILTYGVLYALFVGAMLHGAVQNGQGISTSLAVDLVVSVPWMVMALWLACCVFMGDRAAR